MLGGGSARVASSAGRPKVLPLNPQPSAISAIFAEFNCSIIKKMFGIRNREFLVQVKTALKNIRRLKHDIKEKPDISFGVETQFDEPAVRCAYVYAYGILHTTVVYADFLKYLKGQESIFRGLFSKNVLNICCLAGGPAFEAVSLSKAINDFITGIADGGSILFTDIHLTVVDVFPQWKCDQEYIIAELQKFPNLFHSENVCFHPVSEIADFLEPFHDSLKAKIKDADLVTMVQFGRAIEEKCKEKHPRRLENVVNNVIDCMNEDSCLFVLELSGGRVFSQLQSAIVKRHSNFKMQQSLHKSYRVHPTVLGKMEAVLGFENSTDGNLVPTAITRVSSCIWVKRSMAAKNAQAKEKKSVKKSKKTKVNTAIPS